jgi:ABC-type amino acid transport substrate-binding protein
MEKTNMKFIVISLLLTFAAVSLAQDQAVILGNEPWPPYVLSSEKRGTAERIVCEALKRSGWGCTVRRGDWVETLQKASDGELDGIAALWHTKERAASLKYSTPYLTNRLLPVVRRDSGLEIARIEDLTDLRIVAVEKFAYGEEMEDALAGMRVTLVRGFEKALIAVQSDEADVALIDELTARDYVGQTGSSNLSFGQTALSYRELYFAVSRKHPQNGEIIAAFNKGYLSMLKDGSINSILDIDWVVTDLKLDGIPDFIHRSGENPTESDSLDSVYPISQKDYQMIHAPGFSGANANFAGNNVARDDFKAATNAELAPKKRCNYDSISGRVVCPMR